MKINLKAYTINEISLFININILKFNSIIILIINESSKIEIYNSNFDVIFFNF